MKKVLLILVLCLSTIGLTGCGSSAPTKVTLNPKNGEYQMLEVGKDIAEGNFEASSEVAYGITTQGTVAYDINKQVAAEQKPTSSNMDGFANCVKGTQLTLTKGEFVLFCLDGQTITLSKQ